MTSASVAIIMVMPYVDGVATHCIQATKRIASRMIYQPMVRVIIHLTVS